MPAPYWGNIQLEESLKRAQIASMSAQQSARAATLAEQIKEREMRERHFATQQEVLEEQARMQLQQYQMQYGVGMAEVGVARGRLRLDERKQLWTEYQKELPTFMTVDGTLLATYPDGTATPAWQAPPEPVTLSTEQFLVDPVTGYPIWAPPLTTATDREIVTTDRLTGELINRVALDQLPPKAVFKTTEVGEILVFDEQGTLLQTVTSPGTEAKMQQMAAEAEQDKVLALRAEDRAWEEMSVTKEIADALNITTILAAQIDASVRKYGFDVTATGLQITAQTARELNLSNEQVAQINGYFQLKGQELKFSSEMARIDLDAILGKGKQKVAEAEVETGKGYLDIAWVESGRDDEYLKIAQAETDLAADYFTLAETTEERQGAEFFLTHGLAVRAQISAEKALDINVMLTREGYDLQQDMKKIEYRIAAMTDLTDKQKTSIMAGLEERRLRMESGRIEAEVEAGRFTTRGDVTVRRGEDGTFGVAFEWPQERYGLTPMMVGDEASGYSIAMIDPYKGTVDVLGVLPGGAAGADDAKRHLELLDMARKMVDPGNTFLTTVDPAVKEEMYRQTMALYSDLIQAPRPAGLGYTPEEAARFTTPMELWRAQGISLTFGGTPPEATAEMFEKFLQDQPYGKAVATPPVVTPTPVTPTPTTPTGTAAGRSTAATKWADRFRDIGSSSAIEVVQQHIKDNSPELWDGEVDGVWTPGFERAFKIAYRKGDIKINEPGESSKSLEAATSAAAPIAPTAPTKKKEVPRVVMDTIKELTGGSNLEFYTNLWNMLSSINFHATMRTLIPGYTLGK